MSEDGRTVYFQKQQHAPRAVIYYDGRIRTVNLEGKQLLGRPASDTVPDIAVASGVLSRRHGLFETVEGFGRYRDLGSTNGTMYNGHLINLGQPVELTDGDVLRIHGREDSKNRLDVLVIFSTSYKENTEWKRQELKASMAEILVGSAQELSLGSPEVSREHASFFQAEHGWALIDHGSLNGVMVNHKKIETPVYLNPMDVVEIAGYLFLFTGTELFYQTDASPMNRQRSDRRSQKPAGDRLSIHIEERNVWHRLQKKTLLKQIDMEIPAGSMVLILGGSGAGKTTFMNAVMGFEPAQGRITYRNMDIYREYKKMKYDIGYVPQQDLLRMHDTVYATLENAARMRMPSGLSDSVYEQSIKKTIEVLGLDRVRDSMVGKLSGGQRKRLSIATEYIGNPSLFFLDEPDSGLDGTMARSLMENLRTIADDGKIVIVISHSPDRAFELFDRVIVLAKDPGDDVGHLAFFGTPKEALDFFDVDTLEHVVKRINRKDEGGDGLAGFYIRKYAEEQKR